MQAPRRNSGTTARNFAFEQLSCPARSAAMRRHAHVARASDSRWPTTGASAHSARPAMSSTIDDAPGQERPGTLGPSRDDRDSIGDTVATPQPGGTPPGETEDIHLAGPVKRAFEALCRRWKRASDLGSTLGATCSSGTWRNMIFKKICGLIAEPRGAIEVARHRHRPWRRVRKKTRLAGGFRPPGGLGPRDPVQVQPPYR